MNRSALEAVDLVASVLLRIEENMMNLLLVDAVVVVVVTV
jgi:hypothetical protein